MMGVARNPMRQLQTIWKSIMGNMPPYHEVHGMVKTKDTNDFGMPFITVNAAVIEVDPVTFDRIDVGDNVRVRYTRTAKAISIDKVIGDTSNQVNGVTPQ